MKNSRLTLTIMAALTLMASPSAMAASSTWTGGTGAQEWSAAGNWSGATVPGSTITLANTDVATFNTATPGTAVTIDPNRNIGSITFTTSAGSYTIGSAGVNAGNSLLLTNGGVTSIASAFTGLGITETFNAPLVLEGASPSTAGSYSFTNNAPSANNDTLNFAGNISGGTTGTVTLNLNGTNAGAVNIISGNISNGSASAVSLSLGGSATWLLSGNNSGMSGGTISITPGSTLFAGPTLLIGSNTALGSDTVSFVATTGGATKFGAIGNITVSNNFTGNTTSGEMFVGSGNLTINGTFTPALVTNTSLYNFGTGTLNLAGSFNLQSAGAPGAIFQMKGPGNTTFSGTIYDTSLTGTTVASKFLNFGSGTVTISGTYAATGVVFDYGGTLVLDTSSVGTRLPNAAITLGGVTLDLSGGNATSNQTVNGVAFHVGQSTVQDTNSGTALLKMGAVSVGTGGLVNFGSLAATTSTANGATGILGASYTIGGTDWAVSNTSTTAISAYTGYTPFSSASNANDLLTGSGALTTSIQQNTLKINSTTGTAQSFALSPGVTYTTTGILYTGSDAYSITGGNVNTTQASLILQQWGSGTLTIGSAIADRFNNVISLVKGGTGTLVLSGSNAYTGVTYVTDGTLSISSDSNLGGQNSVSVLSSSTSGTTVTLAATASDLVVGSSFLGSTVATISGTAVTLTGNANQTISSTTSVGFITSPTNLTLVLNGGTLSASNTFSLAETLGSQTVNRSISLGANGGTLDVTGGNTLTVAGVISNLVNADPGFNVSPLAALTKTGAGTLALSGANTYGGGTTISGGILEFMTPTSMPTSGAVNVNSGSTLAIAVGGAGQFGTGTSGVGTIGGIFSGVGGQGTSTVNLNTGSAVGIDTTGGSVTYGGNITNAGVGLTKLGSNALTLTGSNTYTGGTIISSGTLVVSNTTGSATGTGALQLNSGATLTGTGMIAATNATITGNVIVGNGGTTDILHMSATGTTSFTNASLTFNLDTVTQGNSSQLALGATPSVVFGSTSLTLNLVGSNPILTSTGYTLFTSTATTDVYSGLTLSGSIITSGLTLNFTGPNAPDYGGSYLELVSNGLGGDNIVAVVPEPGTWALMLGGLLLLTVCQRARRARNS